MVHEIEQKNFLDSLKQGIKGIGGRSFALFGITLVLILAIGTTFYLTQSRRTTSQNASYDSNSRIYVATFDGSPSSPRPLTQRNQNEFDIQVHSRDNSSWDDSALPLIHAQHGPGCEGPDITHEVDDYEESVFNCRDHMMTAINGSAGYAQIAITPSYLADWRDGELVLKFDMSTLIMSSRDWVTFSITPWDQNLTLVESVDFETPDLSGPPRNALYFSIGTNPMTICVHDIRDGAQRNPVGWVDGNDCSHWDGIQNYITPSPAVRSPFEFRISPDRVTIALMNSDGTVKKMWQDYRPSNHGLGPIPFNEGVVQVAQHSYTPTKDGAGDPATWHFDNISISDATPFTMIKADKRRVTNDGDEIVFNQPAPANSMLRFHAFGTVEVSFDGGAFQPASAPPQEIAPAVSYFTPIPQGTSRVAFRFSPRTEWFSGPYQAKDFAIWSKSFVDGQISPPITSSPTISTPTNAVTPPVTAPQPLSELSLNPSTATIVRGQTFSANVILDTNGQLVNGVETLITYPSNLLSVESVTNGSSFDIVAENVVTTGSIKLAYGSMEPRTGINTLATINFKALANGTANVNFTNSAVADSTFNTDVFKSAINGVYSIIAPTPTPTIGIQPTPSPTHQPTIVPGTTGLNASYYNNRDLTNLVITRVDPVINFIWGSGSPISSIAKDTFSVRWDGILKVPQSASYTITTRSDDGVRVWIDGSQIINNWTNHSVKENSATRQLSQGTHTLRVEYYENTGKSQIQLMWSSPTMTKRVIASEFLSTQ